jgi:hypothetical protein
MTEPTKPNHKGLYAALAAAQADMGPALKDSTNPAFKSKYADLASVMAACMPALSAHGIAVLQPAYDDTLYFAGAPQSRPGRFTALQESLIAIYGVDAPATLVIAPMADTHGGRQFWFRLGQMYRLHAHLSPLQTLFVPASVPASEDSDFAARIHSWEACLAQIVPGGDLSVAQQDPRTLFEAPVDPTEDLAAESDRLARQWRRRDQPE